MGLLLGGERSQTLFLFMIYAVLSHTVFGDRLQKQSGTTVGAGKHPAVVESRFRFTFPERKVKAECMKLTQTGIAAGLGNKK